MVDFSYIDKSYDPVTERTKVGVHIRVVRLTGIGMRALKLWAERSSSDRKSICPFLTNPKFGKADGGQCWICERIIVYYKKELANNFCPCQCYGITIVDTLVDHLLYGNSWRGRLGSWWRKKFSFKKGG